MRQAHGMNDVARSSTGYGKVLLVGWDAPLRAGLCAWLRQEFPAYRIQTAADREKAQRVLTGCSPALVLVNVDAPRGEGFAILQALRGLQPQTLLVALSLYPVVYFSERAMHAGATECACVTLADDRLRNLLSELLLYSQNRIPGNAQCAS